MFGELSEDFILSRDEIDEGSLFAEDNTEELQDPQPDNNEEKKEVPKGTTTEIEEVDAENLFNQSESVGSEEETKSSEGESTKESKDDGTSPTNFYSTTAKAFRNDGIFPELDDATINGIKNAEDFANAVEKTIQSKLDERQRRIDEALNLDIQPDEIKVFENTLSNLDAIKEEYITNEDDNAEKLRGNLIYQDYLNMGYTEERAKREVTKSFNAGTDIEDAKEALANNKKFFQDKYDEMLNEAREADKAHRQSIEKEATDLRKAMLEDKEIFEGVTLTPKLRKEAFENITKPVHKTSDGEFLTSIQKYEKENPVQFRKYLSVLFTMTDSFTNIDNLVKGKVQKQVKQSLRELEHKMTNTSKNSFGNPILVGGVDNEEEDNSYIGKGWSLDV